MKSIPFARMALSTWSYQHCAGNQMIEISLVARHAGLIG
jgi:hypothetical protein